MSAEEHGTNKEQGTGNMEQSAAGTISRGLAVDTPVPAPMLPPNGAPPALAAAPLAYENPAFLNRAGGALIRSVAECMEPRARIRHEHIQDTVVFFGSARFRGREEADHALELLDNTGSLHPAPREERPGRLPE